MFPTKTKFGRINRLSNIWIADIDTGLNNAPNTLRVFGHMGIGELGNWESGIPEFESEFIWESLIGTLHILK